ncbi:hypothetical protein SNEBB_007274 [Seison nebaliae]|nr:hypothetical protein SNEBB_007274 [Seison nebaliae]
MSDGSFSSSDNVEERVPLPSESSNDIDVITTDDSQTHSIQKTLSNMKVILDLHQMQESLKCSVCSSWNVELMVAHVCSKRICANCQFKECNCDTCKEYVGEKVEHTKDFLTNKLKDKIKHIIDQLVEEVFKEFNLTEDDLNFFDQDVVMEETEAQDYYSFNELLELRFKIYLINFLSEIFNVYKKLYDGLLMATGQKNYALIDKTYRDYTKKKLEECLKICEMNHSKFITDSLYLKVSWNKKTEILRLPKVVNIDTLLRTFVKKSVFFVNFDKIELQVQKMLTYEDQVKIYRNEDLITDDLGISTFSTITILPNDESLIISDAHERMCVKKLWNMYKDYCSMLNIHKREIKISFYWCAHCSINWICEYCEANCHRSKSHNTTIFSKDNAVPFPYCNCTCDKNEDITTTTIS